MKTVLKNEMINENNSDDLSNALKYLTKLFSSSIFQYIKLNVKPFIIERLTREISLTLIEISMFIFKQVKSNYPSIDIE